MKLLIMGLITGLAFGFLLQKGRVLRYEKQLGALRLIDMTIFKFMLSAILTGMIGLYLLHDLGMVSMSIKQTILGANIVGGLLFGIGWGLFGLCPGTSLGALGEGRWHAAFGIAGMLAGASLYNAFYPVLKASVLTWGDLGNVTLPDVVHLNHWLVIIVLAVLFVLLFRLFERLRL